MNRFRGRAQAGFTLVELMIVVAVIGVLAAIAVPAYMKYIKRSKAAEAPGVLKTISDGAKVYFESIQYSCKGIDDCAEPWHDVFTPGHPLPKTSYTFPGGAGYYLQTATTPPVGGGKYTPKIVNTAKTQAVLLKLNFNILDPLYFRYRYETGTKKGANAEVTTTATADFKSGGEVHTLTQKILVDPSTLRVSVQPPYVQNEFE